MTATTNSVTLGHMNRDNEFIQIAHLLANESRQLVCNRFRV